MSANRSGRLLDYSFDAPNIVDANEQLVEYVNKFFNSQTGKTYEYIEQKRAAEVQRFVNDPDLPSRYRQAIIKRAPYLHQMKAFIDLREAMPAPKNLIDVDESLSMSRHGRNTSLSGSRVHANRTFNDTADFNRSEYDEKLQRPIMPEKTDIRARKSIMRGPRQASTATERDSIFSQPIDWSFNATNRNSSFGRGHSSYQADIKEMKTSWKS